MRGGAGDSPAWCASATRGGRVAQRDAEARRSSPFQCRVEVRGREKIGLSADDVKTRLWKFELRRPPTFCSYFRQDCCRRISERLGLTAGKRTARSGSLRERCKNLWEHGSDMITCIPRSICLLTSILVNALISNMITCTPRSICLWDFDVSGDGHRASIDLNWVGEQGSMGIDGERYVVSKGGILSGRWMLECGPATIFVAQKSSAFSRRIEIRGDFGEAELSARSAFGRTMALTGPGVDCVIAPNHPFTRRSTIAGNHADFRLVAFAFWLTILMWRRQADST